MNYSNINVIVSTYLKIDRSFKRKLSNIWYKTCVLNDNNQIDCNNLSSRSFHSSNLRGQVKNDGVEVLLSPQEVSFRMKTYILPYLLPKLMIEIFNINHQYLLIYYFVSDIT